MEKKNTNSEMINEMIAEIARSINKIPTEHKEKVLEETIYFIERKCQELEEKNNTVFLFATESIDRVRLLDLYEELEVLHKKLTIDKQNKPLIAGSRITNENTLSIQLSKDSKPLEVTLDTENGALMFVMNTCSDIQNEKYVITEEMVFYKPEGANYHLINSTTLKKIESLDTMQTKDVIRKDIAYNGRLFSETKPQLLNSDTTDASKSSNKELTKVLRNQKTM